MKQDFFKNDLNNIFEYWYDKFNNNYSYDETAKYFKTIFENKEERENRNEALKNISSEIVYSKESYTSILSFDNFIKPLFEKFEELEGGNKFKDFLIRYKKSACLHSFKKKGLSDLEKIENGNLSENEIKKISTSIYYLNDLILKDENANNIFNKMLSNDTFKKSYNEVSSRLENIKELKSQIQDNHFIDSIKSFNLYYKVNKNFKIPEGNDILSIDYREKIMPEIDKMINLLENTDLTSFSEEEIKAVSKINDFLYPYKIAKEEYLSKNESLNNIVIESPKNNIDFKINNFEVDYKADLDYANSLYKSYTNKENEQKFSKSRNLIDFDSLNTLIERLPSNVQDSNDLIRILSLKDSIKNNDYVILNEMNKITSNGFFDHFKNNSLKDVKPFTHEFDYLKKIESIVSKIENKHGFNGIPLFDDKERDNFFALKKISDNFKLLNKTDLNNNNTLTLN